MEQNELLKKYTYVLEENAHIKKLKQTIQDRKKQYQETLQAKDKVSGWGGFASLFMFLLIALLVVVGIGVVYAIIDFFSGDESFFAVIFMLCLCSIILGLICIFFGVFCAKYRDKEEIEKARIHNEEVIPAYKNFKESEKDLEDYMLATKLQSVEAQIPEDYRTEDAILFFIQALKNGRADTEKELYNLYEEEKHRKKMEELTEKKLQEFEESFVHCPSCGSRNCNLVINSQTKSSSFGKVDACCGFMLLGPVGLLCGLCGGDSSSRTDTYWLCGKCGKKFSN